MSRVNENYLRHTQNADYAYKFNESSFKVHIIVLVYKSNFYAERSINRADRFSNVYCSMIDAPELILVGERSMNEFSRAVYSAVLSSTKRRHLNAGKLHCSDD